MAATRTVSASFNNCPVELPESAVTKLIHSDQLSSVKFEYDGKEHEYVLKKKMASTGGTRKIVINCSFGGFQLPNEAVDRLAELTRNPEVSYFDYISPDKRDDPILVKVVEELDKDTRKEYTLKVVEIPDDVEWRIHGYDGSEHVYEKHRTWY